MNHSGASSDSLLDLYDNETPTTTRFLQDGGMLEMRELIANTPGPITVDLCGRTLIAHADATQDFVLARDGLLVIRNGTLDLNHIRLVVRRSPTVSGVASSRRSSKEQQSHRDGGGSSSTNPLIAAGMSTAQLLPCPAQRSRHLSLIRRLSSGISAAGTAQLAQVRLEKLTVRGIGGGSGGIIHVDGGRLACIRCQVRSLGSLKHDVIHASQPCVELHDVHATMCMA